MTSVVNGIDSSLVNGTEFVQIGSAPCLFIQNLQVCRFRMTGISTSTNRGENFLVCNYVYDCEINVITDRLQSRTRPISAVPRQFVRASSYSSGFRPSRATRGALCWCCDYVLRSCFASYSPEYSYFYRFPVYRHVSSRDLWQLLLMCPMCSGIWPVVLPQRLTSTPD